MKTTWFFFCNLLLSSLNAQVDSLQLLPPTGEFAVGTITYEWTDESRSLHYSSHTGDRRTLVVQIWYPAEVDSLAQKGSYAAVVGEYQNVSTNSQLRPAFAENLEEANLILLSPGRGTERFMYTTLVEELASHGYVVAAVDMPEIGYTFYGDGSIIPPNSDFRPPRGMMGGPYELVDQFFERPTAIGFQDLSFALEQMKKLNEADPNERFSGRIKVEQVGLLGHSLGGRIAGRMAAEREEIKALISMEGIPPRDVRYEGKIDFPIAMLCSSGTLPYAIENYNSLTDNRSAPVYMLELVGFGHNSITEKHLFYPENYRADVGAVLGLEISRDIVLNYFDAVLGLGEDFGQSIENIEQLKLTIHD